MKILVTQFLFFSFFFPLVLSAQQVVEQGPIISFANTNHDFGHIAEQEGVAKINFKFTNKGDALLLLKSVEASCGCTSPIWSIDSIMPGEEGFIQVAYDPHNRPGPFNKTVTVTSNGHPAITILAIEGVVVPTPKDIATQYPYKVGGLRFSHRYVHFGNITNDLPVTRRIEAYNGSEQIITFIDSALAPAHITVTYEPH